MPCQNLARAAIETVRRTLCIAEKDKIHIHNARMVKKKIGFLKVRGALFICGLHKYDQSSQICRWDRILVAGTKTIATSSFVLIQLTRNFLQSFKIQV